MHSFELSWYLSSRRQRFSKGEGIGWVWTWAIAVVARSVDCSAIIGIFFWLSVYLGLLSDFCYKNFPLVNKHGLVCVSVLCVLDYEKTLSQCIIIPYGFIFIDYFCYFYIFYSLFLLICLWPAVFSAEAAIVPVTYFLYFYMAIFVSIVFKISILIL